MTGIFRQRLKSNVMFDSHHRVRGQFILINWEWLIRRHSTDASITAKRHWAEHTVGDFWKYILIKTCFSFPERNRPDREEFQWTSGADRHRDPPCSCRSSRRHLLHCQAETFSEQIRSRERAERWRKQTAEGEQSRSLSWASADVGIDRRDPDGRQRLDTFSAETERARCDFAA